MNVKHFLTILFFLFMSKLWAKDVIYYEVKKGDTLSGIIYRLNLGPIYGKSGLQKLSSKINRLPLSGDKIKEGDVLQFPAPESKESIAEEKRSLASEDSANDQYYRLILSPQISRLSFDSDSSDIYQRSRLKTFTKPVPAVNLGYELHWDEKLKFLVFAQFSRVSLYTDDVITYKKKSFSRTNLGMGVGYKRARSSTELRAGFFDEVFFRFSSPTLVAMDVVSLPEVELLHFQTIAERKKMNLQLGVSSKIILPADRNTPCFL